MDLENTKVLEIGYRLKALYWGKGIATEVSIELVKKAFDELGADVVFAKTMKRNIASAKVMQKIGLKYEREFIESVFPGENNEAVRYSIEADGLKS